MERFSPQKNSKSPSIEQIDEGQLFSHKIVQSMWNNRRLVKCKLKSRFKLNILTETLFPPSNINKSTEQTAKKWKILESDQSLWNEEAGDVAECIQSLKQQDPTQSKRRRRLQYVEEDIEDNLVVKLEKNMNLGIFKPLSFHDGLRYLDG
jgi:hypothetical protein